MTQVNLLPTDVRQRLKTRQLTVMVGMVSAFVGNIQFQGSASDHLAVATWLTRLAQVTGWDNSWITASTKRGTNADGTKTDWVDFTGSVDLGARVAAGGK